jgi:hypothetical protein
VFWKRGWGLGSSIQVHVHYLNQTDRYSHLFDYLFPIYTISYLHNRECYTRHLQQSYIIWIIPLKCFHFAIISEIRDA